MSTASASIWQRAIERYGPEAWVWPVAAALAVLAIAKGLRAEYVLTAGLFTVFTFLGRRGRRFAATALPLALVGLIYDHLTPLMTLRGPIHIADLHAAELMLFGIPVGDDVLLPSQWLSSFAHPVLDLPTGFAYLAYLYEVFGVVGLLFLRGELTLARQLSWGFLLVNLIGIATWVVYPAAPPWYVALHGLGPADLEAPASAAGAIRFDELLGIHYFEGFYARSRNVFGAMPSLHVAYPTLVFLTVRRWSRVGAVAAAAFALLVAFAAVYLEHHYVLDVLGGAFAATLAAWVVGLISLPRALSGKKKDDGDLVELD